MPKPKKEDLNIFVLIKQAVTDVVQELGLVTKDDLKYLPTKDEFYEQTLKLYKKMEDLESEKDILSSHSSDHSDRIEALEKIHPKGNHSATLRA
jgi:hypothetical protein